ncbi:MAG: nucleotidyltransferase domain-containing protein [Candidatus Bathyarchaeota archaeon]|nr:nucleotidyltransferase domain-containing protein [Candidatus Bathyarchaeota archaeon]MDH5664348.1 nucleotidyltransferase domain-containing protein [Candidatus Bathyarchaeota archaeon]
MAKKPVKRAERVEVIYDKKRWKLLRELRSNTVQIMEILDKFHLRSIAHGSIARGDVSETSDIDVFLPDPPSSFMIETALERSGVQVNRRIVVQATPLYALKGYIEIDKQRCISFPLAKLRPVEKDFYKFGGEASLSMLKKDMRVSGVDKRLMLIEPTSEGHVESNVVGREEAVANLLGVSLNTVLDRVHALLRRAEVGRTGVFIERELSPDETFELVLKKLADQNPAVRRRLKFFEK